MYFTGSYICSVYITICIASIYYGRRSILRKCNSCWEQWGVNSIVYFFREKFEERIYKNATKNTEVTSAEK